MVSCGRAGWVYGTPALMLCIIMAVAPAQAPQDPMPPAAIGILAQMDKDIAIARAKAVVGLEKVLKDTTKKGDLAGAVAVKETIDQLKAETKAAPRANAARVNGNAIVGRWVGGGHPMELFPDGTGKWGGATGRWKIESSTLTAEWTNGWDHRLTVNPDGLTGVRISKTEKREEPERFSRPK